MKRITIGILIFLTIVLVFSGYATWKTSEHERLAWPKNAESYAELSFRSCLSKTFLYSVPCSIKIHESTGVKNLTYTEVVDICKGTETQLEKKITQQEAIFIYKCVNTLYTLMIRVRYPNLEITFDDVPSAQKIYFLTGEPDFWKID